jgi:hypothetical protein
MTKLAASQAARAVCSRQKRSQAGWHWLCQIYSQCRHTRVLYLLLPTIVLYLASYRAGAEVGIKPVSPGSCTVGHCFISGRSSNDGKKKAHKLSLKRRIISRSQNTMFRQFDISNNQATTSSSEHSNNSDRPKVQVKPRGIGPVTNLTENDVLCGRGGRINGHTGNIQFRQICGEKRDEYFAPHIKKIDKAHIAARVVEHIRSMTPPGRFLKQDSATGHWYDIGDAKAMTKVGQAIREHTQKEEEEESMEGGFGKVQALTESFSNEPLYPGYDPLQFDTKPQPQQLVSSTKLIYQPTQKSGQSQTTLENFYANHSSMGDDQAFDLSTSFQAPSGSSNFSMMSGMSDLFKSSMVSAVSDCKTSSNRRPSTISSLLRESILSDVSDYESDEANHQECLIMGHQTAAAGLYNAPTVLLEDSNMGQGRRLRQGRRRSSLMSIATASTISLLSIASGGSWASFNN